MQAKTEKDRALLAIISDMSENEKSRLLNYAEGLDRKAKADSPQPLYFYRINDLFDIESVFERIKSLVEILADYYIEHPVEDRAAREKADGLLVSLVDIMNIVCKEVQDLVGKTATS